MSWLLWSVVKDTRRSPRIFVSHVETDVRECAKAGVEHHFGNCSETAQANPRRIDVYASASSRLAAARRRAARYRVSVSFSRSRGSPPGKRPNPHALIPTLPATGYLRVPAGAEFIKALMPGILFAIWAKASEALGSVMKKNFAAPSEVRLCRPNSKRSKHALPEVERYAASTTASPLRRVKAYSAENIAEGKG